MAKWIPLLVGNAMLATEDFVTGSIHSGRFKKLRALYQGTALGCRYFDYLVMNKVQACNTTLQAV
jgi:hypothetical protein